MTAIELANIASKMPPDAEIRFVCTCDDNPRNDYYDVYQAYLLQFQTGVEPECALYLTGSA